MHVSEILLTKPSWTDLFFLALLFDSAQKPINVNLFQALVP